MSDKLSLYEVVRKVPDEAKKQIGGGRLKGMTDINPMYRIKTLTEHFGVCGEGWYTEVIEKRTTEGANGELMCFVDIQLFYRLESGEWSKPIYGTGGSALIANEKGGLYADDEGWKKAYTDALSVACKALGIGADVYWKEDRTKYTQPPQEAKQQSKSQTAEQTEPATVEQINQIKELYPHERIMAMLKHYKILDIGMLTATQAASIIKKRQAEIDRTKSASK